VNNVAELQEQLSKFRPGDAVTVGLLRENETLSKKLLLLNADGSMELSSAESSKEPASTGSVQFQAASASELRALRLRHGVKVAQLEAGALRSAGIKEGFIITHIDKQPVTTPQEVEKLLESRTGGMLIEGVHPSGARGFYAIGL
jgi:S1-C subfamily serine protease